ncbi:response regulator transcription factor [Gillisia limnaea]|nr:response regulator transcription factor [Gillisia limnaea]
MENKKNILLVEDDDSLGYLLTEYLQLKGFGITWAKNGNLAIQKLEKEKFDLAVLDVMMPEMDGFTLAEKMKLIYPEIPFIFLSAKSLKIDVLKGFSKGAEDYLKKPIDEEELVIRINILLKNLSHQEIEISDKEEIHLGKYSYKPYMQTLEYGKSKVSLTSRENELLRYFVLKPNEICTHKELLKNIWGTNDYFTRRSLNVFVSRLRKYLVKEPLIKIENIHNTGFIFRKP